MTQELFYIFEAPGEPDLELVCFVGEPKDLENEPRNTSELVSWTYSILIIYSFWHKQDYMKFFLFPEQSKINFQK